MNPQDCDICKFKLKDQYIDGATSMGSWANMCTKCHAKYGYGLGIGKGQRYENKDGKWVCVEGGRNKV